MEYCCDKFMEIGVDQGKIIYSPYFGNWMVCFDGHNKYDDILYCPWCGKPLQPPQSTNI